MDQLQPPALWTSLVTSALIGSERQPIAVPSGAGPLGEIITGLSSSDEPESAFLSVAAAVSLYLDAGRLPTEVASPAQPSELDDLPPAKPESVWFLRQILSESDNDLLTEWLSAVVQRGKRVPEEMLPALLSRGAKTASLRDHIIPALDNRGRWLASLNPEWSYVLIPETEDAWLTGAKDERLAYIRRLRISDPAKARELVASTWDEDPPEVRAAALQAFRTSLSVADEPFLEKSLDDRRKEVRWAAAELLASLPNSALCRRMIDRARPLLSWNAQKSGFLGIGRKSQLEVNLPQACDKAMIRDGIEPKPRDGVGERAWWLMQIISAVPPSVWCRVWGVSPPDLVDAAMRSEWREPLLDGWSKAAQCHHDAEFAEAILPHLRDPRLDVSFPVAAFSEQQLERLVIEDPRSELVISLLGNCSHYWSVDLSRAAIPLIQRLVSGRAEPSSGSVVVGARLRISTSVYAEALSCLSPFLSQDYEWARLTEEFLNTVKFRHDMLEAI